MASATQREVTDALRSALDELAQLKRLLLDAEDTALRNGSRWGLCDCTDNAGNPYQSAWADKWLRRIRAELVDSEAPRG